MRPRQSEIIDRFAYFLPYGHVSPHALELSIPDDSGFANVLYHPTVPMDQRLELTKRAHRHRTDALYAMEQSGYIEKVRRKVSSKQAKDVSIYRLTRSGFYVLTGTYDAKLEDKRISQAGRCSDRVVYGTSYQYHDRQERDDLIILNQIANSQDPNYPLKLDAEIADREFSILASEMAAAKQVRITMSTKGDQLYRKTRLANVHALFRACGYLTLIDFLPMECVIPVIDVHDPANGQNLTIESFSNSVIQIWYNNHERSIRFNDPARCDDDALCNEWYHTPTFYPLGIIPGLSPYEKADENSFISIGSNRYHHTAIGLAAGSRCNYLVYHTNPSSVDWRPTLEKQTKTTVIRALEKHNEVHPHPHMDRYHDCALMICPTTHQFKALFKDAKKRMGRRKGKARKVAKPFDALCIIPLNHAGSIQIGWLMESDPFTIEDKIIRSLRKANPAFLETHNPLLRLAIDNTPVFIAATMNFQKLFEALELYEKGMEFYVVCLPEQVKFIRAIMPDVRFL